MSIKYGHDDDRIATQYAMAHIVRGMNHPSQVIQVGDQIMTIGVDQGPHKNGVGTIDARLRNIDQIPPAAQAIMNNAARHAIEQAGSVPVDQPIRKAMGDNLPDSHKEILRRVAEHTLGEGPHHVSVHYTNQHGEEAVHTLQVGVNVGHIYKQDADRLRQIIPNLSGVHNTAANELLNSVSKEPEDNGYDHLAPGIKQHRATGALFVHGLSIHKEVIHHGEYPHVNSSEKTLAKNDIKNQHMQSGKLRQFAVGSMKGLIINGRAVPIGDVNKAMSGSPEAQVRNASCVKCGKPLGDNLSTWKVNEANERVHNQCPTGDSSMKKSAISLFEESLEDFAKSHDKKPKLGSGARFKELESKVGSAKLAAWIGDKAHGKEKMAKWAAKGRKRVAKKKAK